MNRRRRKRRGKMHEGKNQVKEKGTRKRICRSRGGRGGERGREREGRGSAEAPSVGRCCTLERLYRRKTLESKWRPPETLWSLYSGHQAHFGVCLAAAKVTLESVRRPPD
ncbi:hypothetical protein PoB_002036600 [Plakobranchus ocellatus]|uniref:Uncharacterized protein n=1 Tax=Plakobranchus ocellatus TaxID=259542 RepID=A0AAV3Z3I4_9GAST|nr:hypothetical protein PoB_002036600 [Plakobranchus ocellatus]